MYAYDTAYPTIERWIAARWPEGVKCPRCGEKRLYDISKFRGRRWRCTSAKCGKQFYLCSGTAFRQPKHNFEWYENIIHKLVEGNSVYKIAGSLAMHKGAWGAAQAILAALPGYTPCRHPMPIIKTPRPIVKIWACEECGQMAFWRNKTWTFIRAFVPVPVKAEDIFTRVLQFCLRPQDAA